MASEFQVQRAACLITSPICLHGGAWNTTACLCDCSGSLWTGDKCATCAPGVAGCPTTWIAPVVSLELVVIGAVFAALSIVVTKRRACESVKRIGAAAESAEPNPHALASCRCGCASGKSARDGLGGAVGLLIFRTAAALFCVGLQLYEFAAAGFWHTLAYFTEWNFILLGFYFLLGVVLSVDGVVTLVARRREVIFDEDNLFRSNSKFHSGTRFLTLLYCLLFHTRQVRNAERSPTARASEKDIAELLLNKDIAVGGMDDAPVSADAPLRDGACARCWKKMRRVLMLLHFFAWEIEWAMVLMVDVILWTVLYPTSDAHDKKMHRRFPSLSQHGLNFLLMALDSACHTMIPVLHHATLLYIFGALYCIWTSIRVFLFGPLILNVVERSEVQDWYP